MACERSAPMWGLAPNRASSDNRLTYFYILHSSYQSDYTTGEVFNPPRYSQRNLRFTYSVLAPGRRLGPCRLLPAHRPKGDYLTYLIPHIGASVPFSIRSTFLCVPCCQEPEQTQQLLQLMASCASKNSKEGQGRALSSTAQCKMVTWVLASICKRVS